MLDLQQFFPTSLFSLFSSIPGGEFTSPLPPTAASWAGKCDGGLNHNTQWQGGKRDKPSPGGADPAGRDYDDNAWEQVDAPHDFVIAGKYDSSGARQRTCGGSPQNLYLADCGLR